MAEPLGWERTPRDVTPDLQTYLRARYGSRDTEDAEVEEVEA
jgi:hypothetical protein